MWGIDKLRPAILKSQNFTQKSSLFMNVNKDLAFKSFRKRLLLGSFLTEIVCKLSCSNEIVHIHNISKHMVSDYDISIFINDIALLELETAVDFNSRVRPVCLPWKYQYADFLHMVRDHSIIMSYCSLAPLHG